MCRRAGPPGLMCRADWLTVVLFPYCPIVPPRVCLFVAPSGRCTNLYLCAQSAAGVTLSSLAFKAAAGFILLASTFDGRYATGQLPSLEDYGRW